MPKRKSRAFDALTPFERAVLTLLGRLLDNTCRTLPDDRRNHQNPQDPNDLLGGFDAPEATCPRRKPRKPTGPTVKARRP